MKNLFIIGAIMLVFAASLRPLRADAETVGVILTRETQFFEKVHKELIDHLQGKVSGRNIKFIVQNPSPDPIAWSNAARKLIAADVDVIVAYGSPAALAAAAERPSMPLIYVGLYEPLAQNIKIKNAAGVCTRVPMANLFRYLNASLQGKRIGIMYSALEEDSKRQFIEAGAISEKYGFSVTPIDLRKPADISTALSNIEIDALFITTSSTINSVYRTLMRITSSRKIVTSSVLYNEEDLSTFSFYPKPDELGKKGGDILVKILKGARASDIPASCSKDIVLVFNIGDAQRTGIRIPMDLVTEATRLVQ